MTVAVEDRTPAQAPARREIGVTELDPARRPPEPDGHPDGPGGHGRRLRGHRRGRLLVGRVLGRGDVRRLHPLPQRGPLGAAAHLPRADAEQPAADAAARPEPAGLPALRGRRRRPVRGEVGRERHGRLPRLRRPQRRAQRRATRSPPSAAWTSTPRAPSATPRARCTRSQGYVADGPRPDGAGLRLPVHQGHGRPAQAAAGLRHRQGDQGRPRARTSGSTCTATPPPVSPWSA